MNNTVIPLISVIIPVYNAQTFLHKCVDSVRQQTYTNLEILLVDDGSTDGSGALCDEYAKADERIRVIHQPNGGVSAARNAGIKKARGAYISFVDNDDWVAPTFLETLWNMLQKYDAPVSVVGHWKVHADRTVPCYNLPKHIPETLISAQEHFDKQHSLRMIRAPYGNYMPDKLFKASLFEHVLFPEGKIYEDIWVLYRLFQKINKIAVYNTPLYYYNRQNDHSLSRGKFHKGVLTYFDVTGEFIADAKAVGDTHILRVWQRERLAHIIGFFKRMMLAGFNDEQVIKSMQQELRRNLWLLLLKPWPLAATCFGVCCALSFKLTRKIFLWGWKHGT